MSFLLQSGDIVVNFLVLAVYYVAIRSFKKNPQCSLALLVGMIGTGILFYIGLEKLYGAVLFFTALLSIHTFKGGRPIRLEPRNHEVNFAYCYLEFLRMIPVGIYAMGWMHIEVWFIVSNTLLLIQLALVAGGCLDGYSERVNSRINPIIRPLNSFFLKEQ